MNTSDNRKPRSDSVLKSFSPEIQDEIGNYGKGRSLLDVQEWLQKAHGARVALSAISVFLSEFRIIEQRQTNGAAIRALVAPLETGNPHLTREDLQYASQKHFTEMIVHDSNVSAFNQAERTAVRREELEIRRQEVEIQREELKLQHERVKLEQEKFRRSHCQSIINACNDPKVIAVAEDDELSYGEKIAQADKIMFGTNESKN